MRYIPTSRLKPGMALGQDIYDGAGRLLLAKHLLLTSEYISNLEFLGKDPPEVIFLENVAILYYNAFDVTMVLLIYPLQKKDEERK